MQSSSLQVIEWGPLPGPQPMEHSVSDPLEKKLPATFLSALLTHRPALFLFAGMLLVLLAATAGFAVYGTVIPVREAEWRYFVAALGVLLVAISILLAWREALPAAPRLPDPKALGAVFRAEAQGLDLRFWGVARRVPDGFELWILQVAGDGKARRYWPWASVTPGRDGSWETELAYDALPEPPHKTFALFLVGPDGQRLIHYFQIAAGRLRAANGAGAPGIPELTADMLCCSDERTVDLFEIRRAAAPAPARPRAGRPASRSGTA